MAVALCTSVGIELKELRPGETSDASGGLRLADAPLSPSFEDDESHLGFLELRLAGRHADGPLADERGAGLIGSRRRLALIESRRDSLVCIHACCLRRRTR